MRHFKQLERLLITGDLSLLEALKVVDASAIGVALLVDDEGRLVSTVTDGDLRRGLIARQTLEARVADVLLDHGASITASHNASKAQLRQVLISHRVRHLPLVDDDGRPVDVVTLDGLAMVEGRTPRALIMAGGFGKRLGALTRETPKPLLTVGDRPMMDYVVERLREAGVDDIAVAVHFLAHQIRDRYGDGSNFGVRMTYLEERDPLGTAGAVSMLEPDDRALIVTNADVMTDQPLGPLAEFHEEQGADITISVRREEHRVPFGVVECDGLMVKRITEKPTMPYLVNAGFYMLSPRAQAAVPAKKRFDMPDLIQSLLNAGSTIAAFPVNSYWLDVGRPDEYRRAQTEFPDALTHSRANEPQ